MKKQKYLTYLNNNYFYEVVFEKKQSKLKDLKIKKQRQYRSNQGRSPKKEQQIMNVIKVGFIGLIVTILSCLILN